MAKCMVCGKHTSFGRQESKKRKNRSPRTFKPNLQHKTVEMGGREQRITACTRCLRTMNRANKIRQ